MLREQSRLIIKIHKFLDICLTFIAFSSAYYIKENLLPLSHRGLLAGPNYSLILLMIIIIWLLVLDQFGLYLTYRTQKMSQILLQMLKAVSASMGLLVLCMYLLKIDDVSRMMLSIFFLLNITMLGLFKGSVFKIMRNFRRKGFNFRRLLVIGSKERAKEVIEAIHKQQDSGYKVIGCLDLDEKDIGKKVTDNISITGTIDQLQSILTGSVVDEVIFAMPLDKMNTPALTISTIEELGIPIRIIPDWQINKIMASPKIARIHFDNFSGLHTMSLTTTPPLRTAMLCKNAFDYIFTGIACTVLLPLFLLIACVIKLSSEETSYTSRNATDSMAENSCFINFGRWLLMLKQDARKLKLSMRQTVQYLR